MIQLTTSHDVQKRCDVNIQQITDVVRQTAHGAEETATAAAQQAGQAQELQALVGRFRLA